MFCDQKRHIWMPDVRSAKYYLHFVPSPLCVLQTYPKPRMSVNKRDVSHWFMFIGYWLNMEIYMYVRVLVRRNIARRQERNINYAPERVHIFPYPTNNLFISNSHTHHYHKKLNNIYYIIFINKISQITSLLNKKNEIQNESKPIVATSVSKAVT